MTTKIDALMEQTKNAYMRSEFGEELWRTMIETLMEVGFTSLETEWIVCSKIPRWTMNEDTLENFHTSKLRLAFTLGNYLVDPGTKQEMSREVKRMRRERQPA